MAGEGGARRPAPRPPAAGSGAPLRASRGWRSPARGGASPGRRSCPGGSSPPAAPGARRGPPGPRCPRRRAPPAPPAPPAGRPPPGPAPRRSTSRGSPAETVRGTLRHAGGGASCTATSAGTSTSTGPGAPQAQGPEGPAQDVHRASGGGEALRPAGHAGEAGEGIEEGRDALPVLGVPQGQQEHRGGVREGGGHPRVGVLRPRAELHGEDPRGLALGEAGGSRPRCPPPPAPGGRSPGRIPARAQASIKGVVGKQARVCTPSWRSTLAMASIVCTPPLLC